MHSSTVFYIIILCIYTFEWDNFYVYNWETSLEWKVQSMFLNHKENAPRKVTIIGCCLIPSCFSLKMKYRRFLNVIFANQTFLCWCICHISIAINPIAVFVKNIFFLFVTNWRTNQTSEIFGWLLKIKNNRNFFGMNELKIQKWKP